MTLGQADKQWSLTFYGFIEADYIVDSTRTIIAAVDALEVPALRTRVDRLAVVESVLSPKGPRYSAKAELPLG